MKTAKLADMKLGWFIGNFTPTLHATEDVEVAIKEYHKGDYDEWHYHKIATEYTVIVSGSVEMNGIPYKKGDIIVMEPGEGTDFRAMEYTVTAAIKIPGATNDKYLRGQ
jgi:quercetin dioxygenase-like cupin family protein